MSIFRVLALVGVSILVLIVNILMSVLYMVVYGYLVNPGHPEEFYHEHIQRAAPYCSIIAGVPLMFLAGMWVARWDRRRVGIKGAVVMWLGYAIIDVGLLLSAGMTGMIAILCSVSLFTKLAAAYAGAKFALRTKS